MSRRTAFADVCLLKTPKVVKSQEFCDSPARRRHAHYAYQNSGSREDPDLLLLLEFAKHTDRIKLIGWEFSLLLAY